MKNGQVEGAIRHQATKTHLVLVLSLNKTLRSASYAVDGMEAKEANLTNFKKTVNSLNELVGGSGNLLNQCRNPNVNNTNLGNQIHLHFHLVIGVALAACIIASSWVS
jgi:hypothetical protein